MISASVLLKNPAYNTTVYSGHSQPHKKNRLQKKVLGGGISRKH